MEVRLSQAITIMCRCWVPPCMVMPLVWDGHGHMWWDEMTRWILPCRAHRIWLRRAPYIVAQSRGFAIQRS